MKTKEDFSDSPNIILKDESKPFSRDNVIIKHGWLEKLFGEGTVMKDGHIFRYGDAVVYLTEMRWASKLYVAPAGPDRRTSMLAETCADLEYAIAKHAEKYRSLVDATKDVFVQPDEEDKAMSKEETFGFGKALEHMESGLAVTHEKWDESYGRILFLSGQYSAYPEFRITDVGTTGNAVYNERWVVPHDYLLSKGWKLASVVCWALKVSIYSADGFFRGDVPLNLWFRNQTPLSDKFQITPSTNSMIMERVHMCNRDGKLADISKHQFNGFCVVTSADKKINLCFQLSAP